jgi:hypothetical protein
MNPFHPSLRLFTALASPLTLAVALTLTLTGTLLSQGFGGGPPPMRQHRATTSQTLRLEPATAKPPGESQHQFTITADKRVASSNALPDHLVGPFPNRGNPHSIAPQQYQFELPAQPAPAASITWLHHPPDANVRGAPNQPFGIALNGVLFDPGTAEFWNGDRAADWNYEALGGAVPLGLDANHAHVQPSGAYHYHGLPKPVMDQLNLAPDQHSPLIGWAADGFPIYALRAYKNPQDPQSGIKTLRSSYRLKPGNRPTPPNGPGGTYDGAFIQDYEFTPGSGDLDECNGRFGITPEFPEGTYAYFLTAEWPVIPRGFRGTPVNLRGPAGTLGAGRPPGKGKAKGKGKGPPPR